MNNEETKPASTQTLLVRSKVKKYALEVSKAKRAGKFKRVGEGFLVGVEAEVESKLRALGTDIAGQVPVNGMKFTNGTTRRKLLEKLELCAAQVIHGRVMRHPTIGVTLMD